jgi:type IV secretion system protein VirB9
MKYVFNSGVPTWHAIALTLIALSQIALCGAASAQPVTQAQRIVRLEADGDRPLLLPLVKGFPCVVELPKGEKILDIAIGGLSDWSTAWEIVKRESAFYIKPLAAAQLTTLIVGTTERNYVFDVQPLPATPQNDAKRLSRLVLQRPPPALAVEAPAAVLQASQTNELIRHTEAQVEQIEGQIKALKAERFAKRPRNYSYTMEVVSLVDDIKPTEAFDDGRFTYLKFPNGLQIPAAYRGGLTATDETLSNSHIEDDFLVLHGVHTSWVLRLGGSVIGIHNEKFNPEGAATLSGTSTTATRVLQ